MQILDQLGIALGLATLSGINLYLTVLVTGLAVRFDWVHLADRFDSLHVLGNPMVIAVAGVLFALEFCADKIPWVDSLWDSVHTVIRPIGATLVALQAVGDMPPHIKVMAALLAGGAALTTHGAKAGTRLLINHSPEPVTNVTMSVAEDAAVGGGLWLTLTNPVVALGVFSVIIVVLWLVFPRLWRIIRSTMWLAWQKLRMPGAVVRIDHPEDLPKHVNSHLRELLSAKASLPASEIQWTVRCLSGKCKGVKGLASNLHGLLVGNAQGTALHFAASKVLRDRLFEVPLAGASVMVESRFLSENLIIEAAGLRAIFRFPRGRAALAETVALRIRDWTGQSKVIFQAEPVESTAPPPMPVGEVIEATVISVSNPPPMPVPGKGEAVRPVKAEIVPLPAIG